MKLFKPKNREVEERLSLKVQRVASQLAAINTEKETLLDEIKQLQEQISSLHQVVDKLTADLAKSRSKTKKVVETNDSE